MEVSFDDKINKMATCANLNNNSKTAGGFVWKMNG